MSHTWTDVLSALVAGSDLTGDQATWAMGQILAGEATPSQIAGFAVALRAKGESVEEMTGHPGHEEHDPSARGSGKNPNGITGKTVLTDVGAVVAQSTQPA